MDPYDVVIVGGGPAGLSAALVLGRCVRRVLVCDSGRYRNARSHALHCYLGHDGIAPADLLATSRQQLTRYDTVSLIGEPVVELRREGERFAVRLGGGDHVHARRLLVASGVVDEVPKLAGIDALYGRSIHVCPYCDGWEHREAPVAVYGRGGKGAGLALMLRQWTSDLVLCTDGDGDLSPADLQRLGKRGVRVMEHPIAGLEGADGRLRAICFKDGSALVRQALFFNTDQHQRSTLLEELGCHYDEKGGVVCDDNGLTTVAGVYVAGDASRDVQLVIIAAAEGARAAITINKDLLTADGYL
jgi:thioredoxin reductase